MNDKQEYTLYVIVWVYDGSNIDEQWKVYEGLTFESVEEAVTYATGAFLDDTKVYQIGRVVPLDGDPDF